MIKPTTGVLFGMETTEIKISFIPLTLCHAQIDFSFKTSEFGFEPVICKAVGIGHLELPKAYFHLISIVLSPQKFKALPAVAKKNEEVSIPIIMDSNDNFQSGENELFLNELAQNVLFVD